MCPKQLLGIFDSTFVCYRQLNLRNVRFSIEKHFQNEMHFSND